MATPLHLQIILLSIFLLLSNISSPSWNEGQDPTPTPWPEQFHSILYINNSNALSIADLWYDWPNGRNFNIVQKQLGGPPTYDLEWNNGTSYYYSLDSSSSSSSPVCTTYHFPVGILRPDWLAGAAYLGTETVDGFLCNVWEKADFIRYYEDVATKRPVHWLFYTGRAAHVMTFEVGAVLDDDKWQAPVYCFEKKAKESPKAKSYLSLPAESLAQKRALRSLMVF